MWGAVLGAFIIVLAVSTARATAAPCAKHVGAAKQQCSKAAKRNAMAWPPRPTEAEIKRRIGHGTWRKAERISVCETGGNLRHFPYSKFRGMMGMYVTTYQYGQRVTGYRNPDVATKAEQIAIAVAAWPITGGWNGWGCRGA